MSINPFAIRISKLLKEGGLGYSMYGAGQGLPVSQAQWPTENNQEPVDNVIPSDDVPPSTDQTIVTNGETTPIDEPRPDVAASNSGVAPEGDCNAEIASLLITIGYILQTQGIIGDKFNTQDILSHLNTNFGGQPAAASPDVAVSSTKVVAVPEIPAEVPPVVSGDEQSTALMIPEKIHAYFESRRLLESRLKK
jgi:hypothetical protein